MRLDSSKELKYSLCVQASVGVGVESESDKTLIENHTSLAAILPSRRGFHLSDGLTDERKSSLSLCRSTAGDGKEFY